MHKKSFKNPCYKHGQFGTRLYNTWAHMKQRCYNPKNPSYENYGAKGIIVCNEWQDFEPFYNWARNNGYKDNLTIDRIDFNGNYEPANCRWATIEEQNNNKSDTNLITYNGKTQSLSKWAKELNIKMTTLKARIYLSKMPLDKAFNPKNNTKKLITYNNETHSLAKWADILHMDRTTLGWRLRHGWSIEKAFTLPVKPLKVH